MLNFIKRIVFAPKSSMDVAVASDHRGVFVKKRVVEYLEINGYQFEDFGTKTKESVDYPDYAKKVAYSVSSQKSKRGILICGTGVGMSIAANKVKGIRAARVVTVKEAKFSRLHNDANILCIGENIVDLDVLLNEWLVTEFEGGRHKNRVDKIE